MVRLFFLFSISSIFCIQTTFAETCYKIELVSPIDGYLHSFVSRINETGSIAGGYFAISSNPNKQLAFARDSFHRQHVIELPCDFDQFDGQSLLLDFLLHAARSYICIEALNEADQLAGWLNQNGKIEAVIWDKASQLHSIHLNEKVKAAASQLFAINNQLIVLGNYCLQEDASISRHFIAQLDAAKWEEPRWILSFDQAELSLRQLNDHNHVVGVYGPPLNTLFFLNLNTHVSQQLSLSERLGEINSIPHLVLNNQDLVVGALENKFFIWHPIENIFFHLEIEWLWPNSEIGQLTGINQAGQVVGYAKSKGEPETLHPFIWDIKNGMQDLNELIDLPSGWEALSVANGINNKGQIVGWGWYKGVIRGFILTPSIH